MKQISCNFVSLFNSEFMSHEHHHTHEITTLSRAFVLGIVLNALFVAVELSAGLLSGSLGLISDAGHNLSDVASLALSMLAFHLSRRKATRHYTYGYQKSTVVVSLLNAIILMIAVGCILMECVDKLLHPRPVDGGVILWVAAVGVVVNAFTAWLFIKDKDHDLNVKGAYLHMAADALVSVGVVVSGIIISFTGWYVIDPIIGVVVAIVIIISTWNLLYGSVRLSLDGVPRETDYKAVLAALQSQEGVEGVHHLHIWAISTTETALTAHVVLRDMAQMEEVKKSLKEKMQAMEIHHVTLEFESKGCCCHGGEGLCYEEKEM